jgi:hypothetical protein
MDSELPGFDDASQIISAAFSIREPGGGTVASGRRAHYLVVLEEFIQPEDEELEEMRPTVQQALQIQKEQEILDGYIQELKERMRDQIVINEELV